MKKLLFLLLIPINCFSSRIVIAPVTINGQVSQSIMVDYVNYSLDGSGLQTYYQFFNLSGQCINGTGEGNFTTAATVDAATDLAMSNAVKGAVGSSATNITLAYRQLYSNQYVFTYKLAGLSNTVVIVGTFISPETDDVAFDLLATQLGLRLTDAAEVTKKWAINSGQTSLIKNAALNFTYSIDVFVDDPDGKTLYEKLYAFYCHTGADAAAAGWNVIDPSDDPSAFKLSYQNGTMVLGSGGLTYGNGQWSQTFINQYHVTGWPEVAYGHYIQNYIVSGQGFYNDGSTETTWPYDSPDDTYITIGRNLNAPIHNTSNKKADWGFQRNGDSVQRWQQGVLSGHVYAPTDIVGLPTRTMGVGITTNAVPYVQSVLDVTFQWWCEKLTAAEWNVFYNALVTFATAIGKAVNP